MNRMDIVDAVSTMTSLPVKDSKIVLAAVLDSIKTGLIEEGKVSLTGFGTFYIVERPARKARNPRTGEKIEVAAKSLTKFKPSAELKNLC